MEINKKLFEAKKEIGKISKDSKNPFFKSKYFDINSLLEHVEPILQKHDLLLLQPILDGKVSTVIIDVETGDKVSSEISLLGLKDAQKTGSEITYYRRYTAQSLLGLQAEDDDGNNASKKTESDRKPNLTLEGYNYLISKGSKEEIQTALDGRRMSTEQRNELTKLLNKNG